MDQQVVIVGGGLAGAQVALQLRQNRWEGGITLLSEETEPPYWRPPLSKSILQGTDAPQTAWLRAAEFWSRRHIDLRLGVAAGALRLHDRLVVTTGGETLPYDHLVLATGASVLMPKIPGVALDGVHTLRTLADAVALRDGAGPGTRVAILGGGFIGLEASASLTLRGAKVTIIEREARILARVAAPAMSDVVQAMHVAHGVTFHLGTAATRIGGAGRVAYVELDDATRIECDIVLVCVGVKPQTALAETAGLLCQDGIVVDQAARSSDPAVLALGDCARFPSTRYRRTLRLESIQNAIDGAAVVAATIGGQTADHDPVPMISSVQFGHQLDFIGLPESADRTQVVAPAKGGGFLVLHSKNGLFWAVEGMDIAADVLSCMRKAITTREPLHEHGVV